MNRVVKSLEFTLSCSIRELEPNGHTPEGLRFRMGGDGEDIAGAIYYDKTGTPQLKLELCHNYQTALNSIFQLEKPKGENPIFNVKIKFAYSGQLQLFQDEHSLYSDYIKNAQSTVTLEFWKKYTAASFYFSNHSRYHSTLYNVGLQIIGENLCSPIGTQAYSNAI
jgi:hypothetical protein